MAELSVIIPTTIRHDDIPAVQYLDQCDYEDYEVIIRRDGSASKARNAGIEEASTDKLVFLDDDSMPRNGYLQAAADALSKHMAVAGRVFQPDDAPFSERVLPWYDQGDEPKQTHLVAGCNMAMRRGLFEEIGTFNEDLPWGHEETELAERICKSHTIHYEPSMVVDHYFAESIWAYWKKSYRHGQADVQLWAVEGTPWRRRLSLSLPLIIPREDAVEAVSRMSKRFGRIKALVFGR